MLDCILKSLEELKSNKESNQETGAKNDKNILSVIEKDGRVTIAQLQQLPSFRKEERKRFCAN